MIELKEVTKDTQKGLQPERHQSEVDQGEFVFIVGDSGSGSLR